MGPERSESSDALLAPVRAWLGSALFEERVRSAAGTRSEVPILLEVAGTVLRGSIDLLVESDDRPPMIVDFKTDRLGGHGPEDLYERYEIQRDIYALAVSEASGAQRGRGRLRLPRAGGGAGPGDARDGRHRGRGRARLEAAIGRVKQAA